MIYTGDSKRALMAEAHGAGGGFIMFLARLAIINASRMSCGVKVWVPFKWCPRR